MSLFGEKLRYIREQRGITQEELAELLGTSKQVISRYEKNQRTPKITIAQKYSEQLNVSLNYLIDDSIEVQNLKKCDASETVTFDDFTYAMHNEAKDLSPENKQKLLELAQFFKEQQQKEGEGEKK